MTTTNLNRTPRRAWYDLPVPLAAFVVVFSLVLIGGIVGRVRSAQQVAAVPTPALDPIIIIASPLPQGPVPTAVPPTPAAQVAAVQSGNVVQKAIVVYGAPDLATAIGAVEAGRAFAPVARYGADWTQVDMDGSGRVFVRTSDLYGVPELIDLQPPAPQVVYVAAEKLPAAPTPTEQSYAVTNDPPPAQGDFYTTPPHVDPAAQQALIGSDPNALACGGSPMCGGLTNAQAQAALDAQRAGR